jgi:hypothetical protein
VARRMRCFAGHARGAGDRVPDVIEAADAEPAVAVAVSRRGEEQCRRRPPGRVAGALVGQIIADGG